MNHDHVCGYFVGAECHCRIHIRKKAHFNRMRMKINADVHSVKIM